MKQFKSLFIFANDQYELFEIKRLDQPENADKSKVYFWFLFNRSKDELQKLEFEQMGETESKSFRVLSSMRFEFSKEEGELQIADKKETLVRCSELSPIALGHLENYFC